MIMNSSFGIEKPDKDEIEAIKAYQKKKTRKNLELNEINK